MNDRARILVGVSYDDTGENALRMAFDMARWRPTTVHVAHVLPESAFANRLTSVGDHAQQLAAHPRQLADFVRPFIAEPAPEVVVHVRVGDPVTALLQLALDQDAELLVVGTHGRRGLERFALGSVAQALVNAKRLPVVVAAPRAFGGMQATELPTPECADCVALRKATHDRELWCKQHARAHVPTGGRDPGLIA
jgi:nucleotide-binding universal stress UspA family protein